MQQFVWNDFSDVYEPTEEKHTYYPSVIMNDRRFEIKITDLPAIPYFPVNSLYEWADYRFYGLRSASAYVFVFDLSNLETFRYIKTIREQILESRSVSSVPLLIVGNKRDLVTSEEDVKNGSSSGPLVSEICDFVRKQWGCDYVECSAKDHGSVIGVFKQLIARINVAESSQSPTVDNIQEVLSRSKCILI